MEVESALLFGNAPSAELLRLDFGRPEKARGRKMSLPVKVEIPMDKVAFLPTSDGGHQARLEVRFAVVDSNGSQAEVPVIPLYIDGPEHPDEGDTYVIEESLKMRRDWHRVIVAVYDQATGEMLSTPG